VALLAAAAVLLMLAAWQLWPAPVASNSATRDSPLAAARAAPLRAKPPSSLPLELKVPAVPAQAAVWDLCGIGRMPRPAGAAKLNDDGLRELPPHLGAEPAAEALFQTAVRMGDGDARSRAAAVLLFGFDAQGQPLPQALEQLAAQNDDAAASAWAALRCQGEAACQSATERWTLREPGNAAAWLLWLRHHPGRTGDMEQALAHATHFDSQEDALLAATLAAVPPATPAYLEPALWVYAIGVQAALPMPQLHEAGTFCPLSALASPARRSACEQLARVMTAPDGDLVVLWAGARLAERLAWPAESLQELQQRLKQAQAPKAGLDPEQPLSCASVDALRKTLKDRAARSTSRYSASPPQSR